MVDYVSFFLMNSHVSLIAWKRYICLDCVWLCRAVSSKDESHQQSVFTQSSDCRAHAHNCKHPNPLLYKSRFCTSNLKHNSIWITYINIRRKHFECVVLLQTITAKHSLTLHIFCFPYKIHSCNTIFAKAWYISFVVMIGHLKHSRSKKRLSSWLKVKSDLKRKTGSVYHFLFFSILNLSLNLNVPTRGTYVKPNIRCQSAYPPSTLIASLWLLRGTRT